MEDELNSDYMKFNIIEFEDLSYLETTTVEDDIFYHINGIVNSKRITTELIRGNNE